MRLIQLGARRGPAHDPWSLHVPASLRREMGLGSVTLVRFRPDAVPVPVPVHTAGRRAPAGRPALIPVSVEERGGALLLAPIIGVLAARKEGWWGFYGHRANLRGISDMGRRIGLPVAVLTPEDLRGDRVEAHVWTGRAWRRAVLPMPEVVYNRVPDRATERSPAVVEAKRLFAERGIPLFNAGFFDKRSLDACLSRSPRTARWLLPTEVLEDERHIARWLARYPIVYLKPSEGRVGEGIIQARVLGRQCVLSRKGPDGLPQQTVTSRARAAQVLRRWTRSGGYLLQEGLPLITYLGGPFDISVLSQKDGLGRWRVTGLSANVGLAGHFITQGGRKERAPLVLATAFDRARAAEVEAQARVLALDVAPVIEAALSTPTAGIAEMVIDIGVAADGRLRFFEANAKPVLLSEAPLIRTRAQLRLLRHCESLARRRSESR